MLKQVSVYCALAVYFTPAIRSAPAIRFFLAIRFVLALLFLLASASLITGLSTTLVLAQENDYTVPKTSDGVPDLQGMWTNNTITPLSRPEHFGDKLVLTPQEAIALEQEVAEFGAEQDQPSDPNRQAPSKGRIELRDSYNNFWFDDGTNVAIYNGELRSSLIVDPSNGQIPAYTEAAQERIRQSTASRQEIGSYAGPETRPLAERCLLSFGPSSGPPMLPILYNNHYQIVQSPGYVMILVEMVHDARIIRLDSEPLPGSFTPWMGDSTGHWEGDTLVVQTNNINASQRFRNSSDDFVITERFTRVADNKINYKFTIEDPDTFTQAWSAEIPWNMTEEKLYEYACHEGNYSLPGVLAGARLDDSEPE